MFEKENIMLFIFLQNLIISTDNLIKEEEIIRQSKIGCLSEEKIPDLIEKLKQTVPNDKKIILVWDLDGTVTIDGANTFRDFWKPILDENGLAKNDVVNFIITRNNGSIIDLMYVSQHTGQFKKKAKERLDKYWNVVNQNNGETEEFSFSVFENYQDKSLKKGSIFIPINEDGEDLYRIKWFGSIMICDRTEGKWLLPSEFSTTGKVSLGKSKALTYLLEKYNIKREDIGYIVFFDDEMDNLNEVKKEFSNVNYLGIQIQEPYKDFIKKNKKQLEEKGIVIPALKEISLDEIFPAKLEVA